MTIFVWKSAKENLLFSPAFGGRSWSQHSDIVAHVSADGVQKRIVIPAGTIEYRRLPPPSLARALAVRPLIYGLNISPKSKDDLYLAAMRSDGAGRIRLRRTALRVRGYLRHLWKYGKVGGLSIL